ncbi:MAG TPA: caspase family protein, partial [Blastocatellia bacterium]|nr:caspase family protein [Blastocatellia bacterium]
MRRAFFLLALLIFRPISALPQSTSQETTNRAPFGIELPEMAPEILPAEAYFNISIPAGRSITRIKLWVLEPYADRVGYNISALLNDQALSSVSKTGSGLKGKYLDINLLQNPNIKLKTGKNTLEVMAREARSGITYRCSFVLMLGQTKAAANRPSLAEGCATEISISAHLAPVDPHVLQSDRTAPQVTLTSPAAALNAAATVQSVRVTGSAGDTAGPVRTITINGQLIAETPLPKEKRFSLPPLKKDSKKNAEPPPAPPLNFDTTFAVSPDVRDLLIEATDAAGNRTTVRVPILQPGCADAVIAQRNAALATAKDTGFSNRRYAVVVGISDYQYNEGGLGDLDFAHRDALAFAEWLRKPEGGGFGQKDIVCLTNAEATKPALNRALAGFLDNAGPNDLIFLFLAGHGAPDPLDDKGKLYFLLHDSKISDLEKTALAMNDLGEFVGNKSKGTRLIAFFDTCHSAGIQGQSANPLTPAKAPAQGNRGVGTKGVGNKKTSPPAPATPPTAQPAPASGFNFYN